MGYELQGLTVNIIFDLMFFSSFFVLGGEFWDKLHALFIYDAKVDLSSKSVHST